ncbi:hypothetical protein B0H10DRAFT_2096746, partial [Mycena sp. CBHHK59/15]
TIQSELSTPDDHQSRRSKAQKFRRQIEDAERWLDIAPDCDSTQAVSKILDHNFIDNWSRHRRESY